MGAFDNKAYPEHLTEEIINDLLLGKKVIVEMNKKIIRFSLTGKDVSVEELSSDDKDAKEWRRVFGPMEKYFK